MCALIIAHYSLPSLAQRQHLLVNSMLLGRGGVMTTDWTNEEKKQANRNQNSCPKRYINGRTVDLGPWLDKIINRNFCPSSLTLSSSVISSPCSLHLCANCRHITPTHQSHPWTAHAGSVKSEPSQTRNITERLSVCVVV